MDPFRMPIVGDDEFAVGAAMRVALLPVACLETLRLRVEMFTHRPGELARLPRVASEGRSLLFGLHEVLKEYQLALPGVRNGWEHRLHLVATSPGIVDRLAADTVLELLTILSDRWTHDSVDRIGLIEAGLAQSLIFRLSELVEELNRPVTAQQGGLWDGPEFIDDWIDSTAVLFRALASPESVQPIAHVAGPGDMSNPVIQWHPLYVLVYSILGWSRPELGLARWILAGMPEDGPASTVLRRRWGLDAMAFVWEPNLSLAALRLWELRDLIPATELVQTPELRRYAKKTRPNWLWVLNGNGEDHPLHSVVHLIENMKNGRDEGVLLAPRNIPGGPTEAHLLVSDFQGWHSVLERRSRSLTHRSDGRSWRIHVTSKDVGYVGEFRQSRETGRWFYCKHKEHLLGN